MQDIMIEATTGYDLEMIDGEKRFDFNDMTAAIIDSMDDETLQNLTNEGDTNAMGLDSDQVRAFTKDVLKGFGDNIVPDEGESDFTSPEYYRDVYRTAQSLAKERGVSPATIFQSDELYEELVRRADTPEKFTERLLTVMKRITNEGLMGFAKTMIRNMVLLEGDDAAMIREAEEDILNDPELQESIKRIVSTINARIPNVLNTQLSRFWGEGTYDALPAEVKQRVEALAEQGDEA